MTVFRRMTLGMLTAAAVAALIALCRVPAAAQDAPQPVVGEVTVKIDFKSPAPAPIRERIISTVENVGDKALKGKTLDEAAALQASLTQALKKIFTEVLSGFQVADLTVNIGAVSAISLDLEADHPQVDSVRLSVNMQAGIHPGWSDYFKKRLGAAEADLSKALLCTPVGSARWSAPIVTQMVRDRLALETDFAGFELEPAVELGQETTVEVAVKPAGQTVRAVSVKMRSTTMPSLLLDRLKFDMAAQAETLVGLPVEFAHSHEKDILDFFHEYLTRNSQIQRLGLEVELKMLLAKKNITLSVIVDSGKYSGFLRGKVSVGRETWNPDIEGRLGVFFSKGTEIFSEVNFYPGPIEFKFNLGIGRRIGPNLYVAAGRNFVDDLNRAWISYYLTEDVILSWERNVAEDLRKNNEGSITFKAHDYFSFEVVSDLHTDVWVRLTANL